jgi:hypothetical protein
LIFVLSSDEVRRTKTLRTSELFNPAESEIEMGQMRLGNQVQTCLKNNSILESIVRQRQRSDRVVCNFSKQERGIERDAVNSNVGEIHTHMMQARKSTTAERGNQLLQSRNVDDCFQGKNLERREDMVNSEKVVRRVAIAQLGQTRQQWKYI